MSRPRPQWQLQAKAAQRRDNELQKADELRKVASYFELNTNKSRHHEQWTTEGYYEKANKEALSSSEKKIKEAKLEERRKKLELMLFQENLQYQEEMKILAKQPRFYKNGSYLNKVPTSTLAEINQGIIEKELQLRKQEAELKLHHAWRMRQPELRAAEAYAAHGRCKSTWMEQIIEKELEKKKEEEETKKILKERDEALRKDIAAEKERLKQKEMQMRELRTSLESQIAELTEKESAVKILRKQEERERLILEELKLLTSERDRKFKKLMMERDNCIVNMGLHKYKLKRKVIEVMKEIELDLEILEKMRISLIKDIEEERERSTNYKRVLDAAVRELEEYRERERQRQKNIESMYDGEARLINEKQDKLWEKEREARAILMKDVIETLRRQMEEKIEANRLQQKENVMEREKILNQMESYHEEVRKRERETQLQNASYSTITALQSQLNALNLQKQSVESKAEREAEIRAAVAREKDIRVEIAKQQRKGHAWT